nr:bifunctional glycosyltransferase family 2/GtrA family protein [Bacilli bacterium]
MKRVYVVIPSYEPDDRLLTLCDNLKKEKIKDVIIVNDGSSKKYSYIFKEIENKYKFKILKHKVNMGKGRALKTSFEYLMEEDIVGCVTADSDGQHSIKDIKKCMDALKNNPNSLILGCRDFTLDNIPPKSKFGNNLTRRVLRIFNGLKISDTQTGLRGIPKSFMEYLLDVDGDRFEFETNMLIESKNKYPIVEVPIDTIYDSKENHSTHFNPIVDSYKIYRCIFGNFFRYLLSAVSSFAIDIVLFHLFCLVFKPVTSLFYITIATVLARIVSSIYNYTLNHKFVFKSKEKQTVTAVKYLILLVTQMFVSSFTVTVLSKLLVNISETIIKTFVDGILFIINYIIQKKFIFKK